MAVGRLVLGAALRSARLERGWGLSDLAERAEMSVSFVSEVERGRKALSLESLVVWAEVLETSVIDLLSGLYPFDDVDEPVDVRPPMDGRTARWQNGIRG